MGRVARGGAAAVGFGDPRAGALAQAQVALGGELGVGLDRDPPRDPQLAREIARGRHLRTGPQGTAADRAAQLLLDLRAERVRPVAIDREQELYRVTGTVHSVKTGTGICTSGT